MAEPAIPHYGAAGREVPGKKLGSSGIGGTPITCHRVLRCRSWRDLRASNGPGPGAPHRHSRGAGETAPPANLPDHPVSCCARRPILHPPTGHFRTSSHSEGVQFLISPLIQFSRAPDAVVGRPQGRRTPAIQRDDLSSGSSGCSPGPVPDGCPQDVSPVPRVRVH